MSGLGALLAESAEDELGVGDDGVSLVAAVGVAPADASEGVCCDLLHPTMDADDQNQQAR